MTSNLGAAVSTPFGLSRGSAPAFESEAMSFFRPEFYNRIDAVVTFDPLTPSIVRAIAEKELSDLSKREGLTQRHLRLEWSPRLLDHLTTIGFDPRYGARPLQRAIESTVVTPLARHLVDHPEARGMLRLDLDDAGRLIITAC
jgi:ATP-dependent Clp protease ATP-binding subunit ClpA